MFRNAWFWFCIACGAVALAGLFGGLLYLYGQLSDLLPPPDREPHRGAVRGLPL